MARFSKFVMNYDPMYNVEMWQITSWKYYRKGGCHAGDVREAVMIVLSTGNVMEIVTGRLKKKTS